MSCAVGGSGASSSAMPPHLYVKTSVAKSPMALIIDAIKKLSLTVGCCRCSNRGMSRPEAMMIAKVSNTASMGFEVIVSLTSKSD
jgi:hypothetical protein